MDAVMNTELGNDLHLEVKKCIVERLDLEQTPDEIPNDIPLFSNGLGLDSIDALDLVVAFGKRFKVVIDEEDFKIFASVNHIVDFIQRSRARGGGAAAE